MIIYEPRNNLEVNTPKGKATIWLITEYGAETPKHLTNIHHLTTKPLHLHNHPQQQTHQTTQNGL